MTKQEQTWSVRTKLLLYILPVFRCNNITLLVLSHNSQQPQTASTSLSPLHQLVRLEYCVVYRIYLRLLNSPYPSYEDVYLRSNTSNPGSDEFHISKVDTVLFTYLPYFILFCLIPCHLDAPKMSKSGLGLYNIHKL